MKSHKCILCRKESQQVYFAGFSACKQFTKTVKIYFEGRQIWDHISYIRASLWCQIQFLYLMECRHYSWQMRCEWPNTIDTCWPKRLWCIVKKDAISQSLPSLRTTAEEIVLYLDYEKLYLSVLHSAECTPQRFKLWHAHGENVAKGLFFSKIAWAMCMNHSYCFHCHTLGLYSLSVV